MAFEELNKLRSVEELAARRDELEGEMNRLDGEAAGIPFTDEQRESFASAKAEREECVKRIEELQARAQIIDKLGQRDENTERLTFNTARSAAARTENIYDLTDLRTMGEDRRLESLRDRALRSIETTQFPDRDARDKVAHLVDNLDSEGVLAERILRTGSPTYKRAFAKVITGRETMLSHEERTALGLTGSAGGYAVPYIVDPTVVLTSDGALNPVRQIARVITITGNHWTGIATQGVTAAYAAEATEMSDNSPSFSQPTADVERAQAYVQYSNEIGQDWGALQDEMARLFADAKDVLESNRFLHGLGHTSNQPEGLLVGATGTVLTATGSVMAASDLYSLTEALAPRWRGRASFVGSLAAFNKIRQFDSSGGANLWVQLREGQPAQLLGKPDYEWSDYSSGITTPNASVLTFGDFNEFTIVDRIGMNVEVVPHVFATANNRPTGERGLIAFWRNTSDVRTAAAFKTLKIKS